MLEHRPPASPELVEGYRKAAELATARAGTTTNSQEKTLWIKLAEYCTEMSHVRATDDDQYQFQRDRFRRRREIPMTNEDMDRLGLNKVWDDESRALPEWQAVSLELALGYLTPMQRVCFELHEGGKLSYKDIAAALNATVNEIWSLVKRARAVLREKISPAMLKMAEKDD